MTSKVNSFSMNYMGAAKSFNGEQTTHTCNEASSSTNPNKTDAALPTTATKVASVATSFFSALSIADTDASTMPLISNKFPAYIVQLAKEKRFEELRTLLVRISETTTPPAWWTTTLSKSIEALVIYDSYSFGASLGDSKLYAKLEWKNSILSFFNNNAMTLENLQTIHNCSRPQFFLNLFQTIPLAKIRNQRAPLLIKDLYTVDAHASSILVNRAIDVTGSMESPDWWSLWEEETAINNNRYIICDAAIQASDRTTALRIASLPLSTQTSTIPFVAAAIIEAAKKDWADVCKAFIANGAPILPTDSHDITIRRTIFSSFPNNLADIVPATKLQKIAQDSIAKKDWTTLFTILNAHTALQTIPTWLVEIASQTPFLKTITDHVRELEELTINPEIRKSVLMIFCELKWESFALACATPRLLALTNLNKKSGWQYLEELDKRTVASLLNTMSISDQTTTLELLHNFFKTKNKNGLTFILGRLENENPVWWQNPKQCSQVFSYAVHYENNEIALKILPKIDIEEPCYRLFNKPPIMIAAEKKWNEGILALVARGALLQSRTEDRSLSYQSILDSHCVELREIVEHMPPNGAATLLNMNFLNMNNSPVAPALIAKVKNWINSGHLPCVTSLNDLSILYDTWGDTLATNVLENLPLQENNTWNLLKMLCERNHVGVANLYPRLIASLGTSKQPSWWNTECAITLYKHISEPSDFLFVPTPQCLNSNVNDKVRFTYIAKLLPLMKMQEISPSDRQTLYEKAFRQTNSAWLLGLIEIGLPINAEQLIAIYNKYGKQKTISILEKLTLNDPKTHAVLLALVKNVHADASILAQVLVKRLLPILGTTNCPLWLNKARVTDLFFAFSRARNSVIASVANSFVHYLDPKKSDVQNKNRTPLMIALTNNFSASNTVALVSKSSLFHVDTDNKSAFAMLLEKQSLFAGAQTTQTDVILKFQECLKACKLPTENVEACTTVETLVKYLQAVHSIKIPPLSHVLLYLLYNQKTDLKKFLKTMSLQERLDLVPQIEKIAGDPLRNLYVDIAFEINPSHFEYGFASEEIPPKEDSSIKIAQVLLKLYDEYAQTKDDTRKAALITFADRVTKYTPFIGTPIAGSPALKKFYDTIDNASCNTIKKLTTDMKKLQAEKEELERTHKPTDTIANKINEQLNKINLFLDAYIEAGPICGGAYMSNATQQYSQVVLGKSSNLKSTIETQAGLLRQHILERLSNSATKIDENSGLQVPEDQTTHLYDLFLREKGKKYGIPGNTMVNFDDACVHERNRVQVAEMDKEFPKQYRPSFILDCMQKSFEDEPQHGQLVTKLQSDKHADWCDIHVPQLMDEIQIRFPNFPAPIQTLSANSSATTSPSSSISQTNTTTPSESPKQQKVVATPAPSSVAPPACTKTQQEIADFLANTYFITLENETKDLTSLKTLEQALRTHPQLYLAYNREGKTFTKEASLQTLIDFQILQHL